MAVEASRKHGPLDTWRSAARSDRGMAGWERLDERKRHDAHARSAVQLARDEAGTRRLLSALAALQK
jgi:hypothetical protein